jgi:transcriptional regulator MraZ
MLFRGLQTGRVDEKGRLKLPVLVRQRIEDHYRDLHVFITSLDGEAVKVFPLKEWETVEARLSEKSPDGKESDGEVKDKILFQTQRFGAEETLDNQGRILVPAVLREAAGMRGEVKILWQSNHLLVLNAERFDNTSQQSKLNAEDRRYAANLGV